MQESITHSLKNNKLLNLQAAKYLAAHDFPDKDFPNKHTLIGNAGNSGNAGGN